MSLIVSEHSKRWPGGCIVWRFAAGLTPEEKDRLSLSMGDWQSKANVRFLERTVQDSFVTLRPDNNVDGVSHSAVGMQGGEQSLYLEPITDSSNRARISRHELGHTIGLHHEHKRCDRDDFVSVSEHIKHDRSGDYHPKLCGGAAQSVGNYDFRSVMHYNPSTAPTDDGSVDLTGAGTANQALLKKAARSNISQGDVSGVATLHGGNAHVYQLSGNGQIEKTVRQYSWTNGWTIATPFLMDARNFLFLLKKTPGTMHVNALNYDGSIGSRVDDRDWSNGWTAAIKYAIGPFNYLLLYKRSNGTVHIHNLNGDGSIGPRVRSTEIESGWTTVRQYSVGLDNFVLLLNSDTGRWRVRRLNLNGDIGDGIQTADWSPGWTSVAPYTSGGNRYLFCQKASNGLMRIRRILANGKIGADVDEQNWSSGWTKAVPYEVGGNAFVLLLKSGTGRLEICRLKSDGKLGAVSDRREFGPGWTLPAIYNVGFGTYLLLVKT